MAAYSIDIRLDGAGKYGYIITDGRGSKIAGLRGCASMARAEKLAREKAERLIEIDKMLGRRSYVESGMPSGRSPAAAEAQS